MSDTKDLLQALMVHRSPVVASMESTVIAAIAAEAAVLAAEVQPYRAQISISQSPFDFQEALKRAEVA